MALPPPGASRAGTWAGLASVAGQPVHAVPAGGLSAAVSTVSLAEFGQEPLRRHLEDLTWLEQTARAHHHVVEAVADGRPVIPMRLATLYHDDGKVAAMLAERHDDFAAALDQVTGQTEWGVKLYAAPPPAAGTDPVPAEPGTGPGASYLSRRRAELTARVDARRADAAAADAVHAALMALASAAQLRPAQATELSDVPRAMILNGTYLVADAESGAFAAAARELADRFPGLGVELTGPWPPYSFAAVGASGPPG